MDILYQRKQATALEVLADLPDAPSYSTVRTLLRVLKDKGHIQHHHEGPRYVYKPTVPRRPMMTAAGLAEIVVSDGEPFWHAIGKKI